MELDSAPINNPDDSDDDVDEEIDWRSKGF